MALAMVVIPPQNTLWLGAERQIHTPVALAGPT